MRLSWSSRIINELKVKQWLKTAESPLKQKFGILGLGKANISKNLFDYGDRLINTIEVLGKYDGGDEKNEAYPRITEKAGYPLHSMTTAMNSKQATAAPFDS